MHTPSPWLIAKGNPWQHLFTIYSPSNTICVLHIPHVSVHYPVQQAEADAQLIASAPDLLASLEQLVDCITNGRIPPTVIEGALYNIARARGVSEHGHHAARD